MKRLNADTKVHLAHVQAFFINWKVLLEKIYPPYTPYSVGNSSRVIVKTTDPKGD